MGDQRWSSPCAAAHCCPMANTMMVVERAGARYGALMGQGHRPRRATTLALARESDERYIYSASDETAIRWRGKNFAVGN